jgi:hypothetical protein
MGLAKKNLFALTLPWMSLSLGSLLATSGLYNLGVAPVTLSSISSSDGG